MLKFRLNYGLVIALCLVASMASADSLELKNGSLINPSETLLDFTLRQDVSIPTRR